MLKENEYVKVRWNVNNREHYENLGYIFTKNNSEFEVKVKDLPLGSHVKISVICDYCGEEIKKSYKDYIYQHKQGKDCCGKCKHIKICETDNIKYGGNSPTCDEIVRQKQINTLMEKYNVVSPAKNENIKNKMLETSLRLYGTNTPSKSDVVKKKMNKTCIEKYGGKSSQCDINIRKKTMETRMKNGSFPVSKQELSLVKLLKEIYGKENCFSQYILDKISFDCLLIVNNIKIDVEYDGNYWHKDKQKDRRRDYYTISKGYKVLRFKSDYNIPTKQQIIDSVNYLINTTHHYLIIDI